MNTTTLTAQPFLRWAGGKRSLLHRLLAHAPKHIATYHEPFAGGAALFFALQAEHRFTRARLNDFNERLMRTYGAIQKDVEGVIRRLRRMPNEEEFFKRQCDRLKIDDEVHSAVAAWMIYLNRTCYNGLYRVNRKNQFNAPFGHLADPPICNADNLRAVARALDGVKLTHGDFLAAAVQAKEGDFVYFDSPYMLRSGGEFVSYSSIGFGHRDQVRLANTARTLKEKGVRVLLSNSDTDEVRELYAGFEFEEVRGRRSVGRDVYSRGAAPDLLIW